MSKDIIIRQETIEDYYETENMVMKAFWNLHGPGCNEHLLVHKLRESDVYLPQISRIAEIDGQIVGTIMYSKAVIHGEDKDHEVLTFGPLCVLPGMQDYGVGGKLLEYTMNLAREAGYKGIVIFGEPGYYPKHGFKTCDNFGIRTMWDANFDSFMGIELVEGAFEGITGKFEEGDVFGDYPQEEIDEYTAKFSPIGKAKFPGQWDYQNASMKENGYEIKDAVQYKKEFREEFNAYIKELIQYNSWLKDQVDSDDNYLTDEFNEYFNVVEKKPYVIKCDDKIAGLVVFSLPEAEDEPDGCSYYIEECYIEPEFRKNGIAKDMALSFTKQNGGVCGLCILSENTGAISFWEHIFNEAGYTYSRENCGDGMFFYKVEIN